MALDLGYTTPAWWTDHHFIKFARARNMNKDAAIQMLRESIEWRIETGRDSWADQLPPETVRLFEQYNPAGCVATPSGHMVTFEQQKRTDVDALKTLIPGDPQKSEDYAIQRMVDRVERSQRKWLLASSMMTGHLILGTTLVKDLGGMGVMQLMSVARKNIFKSVSKILSDHYPESLCKVYVVNAPRGVGAVWSIVKQFLDANTASKVEFLSKLSDLSEKLGDMSTMPDFLGGQVPEDVAYDAGG